MRSDRSDWRRNTDRESVSPTEEERAKGICGGRDHAQAALRASWKRMELRRRWYTFPQESRTIRSRRGFVGAHRIPNFDLRSPALTVRQPTKAEERPMRLPFDSFRLCTGRLDGMDAEQSIAEMRAS